MALNKAQRVAKTEKIVNDFLLQLTYAILSSILLLFLYNGRLFRYGNGVGAAMPTILWTLFGISLIIGIIYICLWKTNKRNGYKIFSIYMFVTSAGFFWCIGIEKIAYYLSKIIPFFSYFANAKRLMEMLFIIIALSLPVEIVVYFIRIKKLKAEYLKGRAKK